MTTVPPYVPVRHAFAVGIVNKHRDIHAPHLQWVLRAAGVFSGLTFETEAAATAYRANLYTCAFCGVVHRIGSPVAIRCTETNG